MSNTPASILSSPIEYLHGISAIRGDMLRKELEIFTWKDMLDHFPLRHVDKTRVDFISGLSSAKEYAQVAGTLISLEIVGVKGPEVGGTTEDKTGIIELVWFQGIQWLEKSLEIGHQYLVLAAWAFYGKPQLAHPEMENYTLTCLPEIAPGASVSFY